MPPLTIAFLGDIVGEPGRRAFAHAAGVLRARGVGLIVVNGENSKHGSGLSAVGYRAIRDAGADAVTLGDHVYREKQAIPLLEDPAEPVARPANLTALAPGKTRSRIARPGLPPVYVVTVLGRQGMTSMLADDPFAAVDRELAAIPEPDALALVEVHGEATSEKHAMAWWCARRWPGLVVGVVGTHTHVQTADARIVERRLGAITDLGMCGPHRSVLGRSVDDVLRQMTTQTPTVLEVADGDERACGCVITVDARPGRASQALAIEPVNIPLAG